MKYVIGGNEVSNGCLVLLAVYINNLLLIMVTRSLTICKELCVLLVGGEPTASLICFSGILSMVLYKARSNVAKRIRESEESN
jgi:hypothetical protein